MTALVHNGHQEEAIRHLQDDRNIENRILHADLVGNDDPLQGVELLLALDETLLDDRLKWVRWQAVALLLDAAGFAQHLETAVAALTALSPSDPEVGIMDALLSRLRGADEAEMTGKLICQAGALDVRAP